MNTVRILFDLRSGIGLGDATQMGILFRHLRKYRPHWVVDVRCPDGFAACFVNCVNMVWGQDKPNQSVYEQIIGLNWTDCFETFGDRPSTKVAYALKNMFGIAEYDPALGRYEVQPNMEVLERCNWGRTVACHFVGNSHPEKKNLSLDCRETIRRQIQELNGMPLGLDYYRGAGELAAAISKCKAFIGIDSGPGKVASATDTPSLICWTGHHPLRYHDPAPNTTHLIPWDWKYNFPFTISPVLGMLHAEMKAAEYFEANYKFITYRPGELAQEACRWLRETLS